MSFKHHPWSRDEVVVMLATLNFHIAGVREQFLKDKKMGIELAANLISRQLENCSTSRVSSKIQQLWRNHGPDGNVADPVDPMYITGAWNRTLPKADGNLLKDVNSKVELMQATTIPALTEFRKKKSPEQINLHSHNTRSTAIDINQLPTRCRCGFVHCVGGFVLCEKCKTWQHTLCYYETDYSSNVDPHHVCDVCTIYSTRSAWSREPRRLNSQDDVNESEEKLSRLLAELRLQSTENEASTLVGKRRIRPKREEKPETHGGDVWDLIEDDTDVYWGPEDAAILKAMLLVSTITRKIARLLNKKEFVYPCVYTGDDQNDLKGVIQDMKHSMEDYLRLLDPASSTQAHPIFVLRSLIGAAMWKWTFEAEERNQDSIESILLGRYQSVISERYGSEGLVAVQDIVWRSVVQECCHRTNALLEQEAKTHARRLLTMLSSFVTLEEGHPRRLDSIEHWTDCTTNGKEILDLLIEAFQVCIKQLRIKLPLSRQWYEFYHPQSGVRYDSQLMEDEDGVLEKPEAKVSLTLSPAIIEYDKDTELGKAHCHAFSTKDHFVHAKTAGQRTEGRVVCPAIVVLA